MIMYYLFYFYFYSTLFADKNVKYDYDNDYDSFILIYKYLIHTLYAYEKLRTPDSSPFLGLRR